MIRWMRGWLGLTKAIWLTARDLRQDRVRVREEVTAMRPPGLGPVQRWW
jgi:hypothetical protein